MPRLNNQGFTRAESHGSTANGFGCTNNYDIKCRMGDGLNG